MPFSGRSQSCWEGDSTNIRQKSSRGISYFPWQHGNIIWLWKLKLCRDLLPFFFFSVIEIVVQSLSCVRLFETPWAEARQASLSFTISWSLLRFVSVESVMPPNHLVLCYLLLLSSIFPVRENPIRVFFNELALHIRWPRYWSFSFSISPFNEYSEVSLFFFFSL